MSKMINRLGEKYGRLTVVERAPDYVYASGRREVTWRCKCDCGNEVVALACNLSSGNTKSCGCYEKEKISKASRTHGGCLDGYKHREKLYHVWDMMKQRCFNANNSRYKRYGGRGISVCDEWKNEYSAFREWAYSNGYSDGLTIDRIDNDGDYCPENCRWVNRTEQANNKSTTRFVTAFGKTMSSKEWETETGMSRKLFLDRIDRLKWSAELAITTPKSHTNTYRNAYRGGEHITP